ncbi:MAG: response regulator [bacterium]|nr:response regulator [bacterium]
MTIEGFTIKKRLYTGKHFTVYRAIKNENDTPCILKALNRDQPGTPGINPGENEFRLLRQIDSDYVIKAYDKIDDGKNTLLVLEDIEGETLKHYLKNGPFPINRFLRLAGAITGGLAAVHKKHIIHKDINPTNIILDRNGDIVKIIDFDIAVPYDIKVTLSGNPEKLEGTLPYISPEQTGRMNRKVDQRTDLYSLGVTFYEMLTNQLPFDYGDPMELVYAHIARQPQPPHHINNHIPGMLSKIILKLLAKNQEDRYQSAEGLYHDIKKIKIAHEPGTDGPQKQQEFHPGEKDYPGKLIIPGKLYGRDNQLEQLAAAYRRVTTGGTGELVLVPGYSGTGKTTLVNEIHRTITGNRTYFISGKFDYLQRDIPYFAFTRAITQFCNLLVTENKKMLEEWKQRILQAVGNLGKVLTDIIPNLEHIIGKQPDVPQIGETEEKNRFNYVFLQFMRAISIKKHPLIMFIDDLQNADQSSLELLQMLASDHAHRYLLLIGTYRDNEVNHTHPLTAIIEELNGQGHPITAIPLKNLEENNIRELLKDTLTGASTAGPRGLETLANRVYCKTEGNAFFAHQFLTGLFKEQLIHFNYDRCEWEWDIDKIDRMDITENVVELLLHRLQALPREEKEILKLSACIGNSFDVETLAKVTGKDNLRLHECLELLVRENWVQPLDAARYKFGHDRILQAAYASITGEDKKKIHLGIGKILAEKYQIHENHVKTAASQGSEQAIFEIVKHYNSAVESISAEKDILRIARLNLKAAQKAKAAAAYQLGRQYARQALDLLPPGSKEKYYNLTLAVYNEAIQLAYSSGNYDEIERLSEKVSEFAAKIPDKSTAYEYRIQGLVAGNEFARAIDLLLVLLKKLGIDIPRPPGENDMKIFAETKTLLEKEAGHNLQNLPPMTDEKKKLALRLYLRTATAISLAAQDIYQFMVNKMLHLTLQHGLTPETPYLLIEYAFFAVFMGNKTEAFKYSKLAMALLDKLEGFESMKVRLLVLDYGYISHWKVNYKEASRRSRDLYRRAVEAGDLEYAAYAVISYFFFMRYTDENLASVLEKGKEMMQILKNLKQPYQTGLADSWYQVVEKLLNRSTNTTEITDTQLFPLTVSDDSRQMHEFYKSTSQIFLNSLFDNTERPDCAEIIQKTPILSTGFEYPNYEIYSTLLKLQAVKETPPGQNEKQLEEVRQALQKVKEWADIGPENYLQRYYMIRAELNRVEGKTYEAGGDYDRAVKAAGDNRIVCDEALANQLAAKFYLQNNREQLAGFYFRKAYHCYRKWGANAKLKQMEEKYPRYLDPGMTIAQLTAESPTASATGTDGALLDIKSIVKASQTLSSEVHPGPLLEKMIHILVENAGAQKALFIENRNNTLLIQAEGNSDGVTGILSAQPVDESEKIPQTVINFVARTKQTQVFDNLSQSPHSTADQYIQHHHPKSAVCFPILSKGEISAIIYLENNLVEGAFTPARLEVLNTLSSQISISMENTRIYSELDDLNKNLEQKVSNRTKEIAEKNQILEQQSQQLKELDEAKTRFFTNISHEFRTPLTLIMGPLEQLMNKYHETDFQNQAHLMLRNSQRLLNQVNQLLELAQFDSGKMKLHAAEQDIISFAKTMAMNFESLAQQEKINLEYHAPKKEIKLYFDGEKMEKVLSNLLANAFNYTPEGGTIAVKIKEQTAQSRYPSGSIAIAVCDTGSGIPTALLPHIFDRFFRVEGDTGFKRKGTGIGLALTKDLVELHRGFIEVHSAIEPGDRQGTEFTIHLPRGTAHLEPVEIFVGDENIPGQENAPLLVTPQLTNGKFAGCLIQNGAKEQSQKETVPGAPVTPAPLVLVVEDNPDVRHYIIGALEPQYKTAEAQNGRQGILRAKDLIPDLIISDIKMARETDGLELCRTLKKDVLTSHIPIILLTARSGASSELEGLECGADDYITKPFSTTLLLERTANLIRLRGLLQQERKNNLALQPTELPASTLDDPFYTTLQETLEAHLASPDLNVDYLAGLLSMSPVTLYRKTLGLTGKTPVQYIRAYRLKRAAQMLTAGTVNVAETVKQVGFNSLDYFSRCFKEQFNRPPSHLLATSALQTGAAELTEPPANGAEPPGAHREKEIILVVEDNNDARRYIRDALEPQYRVLEAANGRQGIDTARETIPDLVVSDVMMPGTDGFQLCRELKKDTRSTHIPIVLLTARASEAGIIEGLECGADDYVVKPFNPDILMARIKNLIDLRSQLHLKRYNQLLLMPGTLEQTAVDEEFTRDLDKSLAKHHADPDFTIQQLADTLYMSSASLYRKIRAISGDTPSDYIRSYRLNRAARLFKKNFGTVTEVAFEVGFKSRSHFTRCFKEKFHQLPSSFMLNEVST